eukprot:6213105-Pleurochrysis_carterae.AAC.1
MYFFCSSSTQSASVVMSTLSRSDTGPSFSTFHLADKSVVMKEEYRASPARRQIEDKVVVDVATEDDGLRRAIDGLVAHEDTALNEYATCYLSCYARISCNAKWPHVGVFGALGQVLARMRIYDRLQKCSV